ncbi:hypothetical protein PBY51_013880 [Eleginops maclovinus]|uniref:Uncharacterized protein n=1 Tax=Eleginops maclovinus TaxID=56733 RepID=A0AAN8A3C7_ELEMC|nr:hypothetical protein PBY51_013880 [Eleginops maclovinus]
MHSCTTAAEDIQSCRTTGEENQEESGLFLQRLCAGEDGNISLTHEKVPAHGRNLNSDLATLTDDVFTPLTFKKLQPLLELSERVGNLSNQLLNPWRIWPLCSLSHFPRCAVPHRIPNATPT